MAPLYLTEIRICALQAPIPADKVKGQTLVHYSLPLPTAPPHSFTLPHNVPPHPTLTPSPLPLLTPPTPPHLLPTAPPHHLIPSTYLNPTSGNTLHTEHLASCLTGCVEEGEEGEGMVIISSSSSKMHNFKTRPEECTCLGSCQPVECGQPYYPHWLPQDPAKKLVFIQKVCGLVVHLVRG